MRRALIPLIALVSFLMIAAPAAAVVSGEGIGSGVTLIGDATEDSISLTCVGGMAPGGFATQIPCSAVKTVFVNGGAGDDSINLSSVGKAAFPALERTTIGGGEGDDDIDGSQVEDVIEADYEDAVVDGGAGNDSIEAGLQVFGGSGDDHFSFSGGEVSGGLGDDRFSNAGAGPFPAGSGFDTFELDLPSEGTGKVDFSLEDGALGVETPSASNAFLWNSMERVRLLLRDGSQSVDASKFSGVLEADGRGGSDTLIGGPGEDLLLGGSGDDDLIGNGGFDLVKGDAGADQLSLRDGGADRGVCGDDGDAAIADAADSLFGCEAIDLPAVAASPASVATTVLTTPPRDIQAPNTKGLKGPRKVFQGKSAAFVFASTEAGGTFKCKLDKGPSKSCGSPFQVKTLRLSPGRHTLAVVAIDSAGNADPTPATLSFTVSAKSKPAKRG